MGGVDTHRDVNVGAVVDMNGGLLGVESFPTNADGHRCLSSWMSGFARIERVGIEGTGAYGAGVARHFVAAGVAVKIMTIDQANVSLNVLRDTGSDVSHCDPKSGPSAEFVDAGPVLGESSGPVRDASKGEWEPVGTELESTSAVGAHDVQRPP